MKKRIYVSSANNGYIITCGTINYIAKTELDVYNIIGQLIIKGYMGQNNLNVTFNVSEEYY